jgi:PAS domain S-box-containing protein
LKSDPIIGNRAGRYCLLEDALDKDHKEKAASLNKEDDILFRDMVEAIPGIVYQFVLHHDGSFSMPYVSRRIEDYSDRSPEEIIANPPLIFEHVQSDDMDRIWRAIYDSAKTLKNFSIEYMRTPPGGQTSWFRAESTPRMLPNGDILWNGVVLDITDQKNAEQSLKDSEERVRLIAEGIREVFWIGSPDLQKVYYVSPAYEFIWDRSVESLYEDPFSWLEALPQEDRSRVEVSVAEGMRDESEPRVLPEYRVIQKDGSFRWMEARYYPVKDDQGRVYRLVGIAEDITERKKSETEIRRLAAIVESSDDAIYATDLKSGIIEWNPGAERLYGYKKSEIIGRPVSILFPSVAYDETTTILEKIKNDQNIDHFETVRLNNQGKEIHVSLTISPIKGDSGAIIGVSTIARDITHRKKFEQEREVTIELLNLINRSSDLRGLMRAATGMLQQWSGCDAVGIRLQDGDDYPYFETNGFPTEFVKSANRLCAVDDSGQVIRDKTGNPVLECMCGNVIERRFDPLLSFFTDKGSFWTNSMTEMLASSGEIDRQFRMRDRCLGEGYESVALVPLRSGEKTFGLLQFNDCQKGRFDAEKISLFERLANSLALGLAHHITLTQLSESEARYRTLYENADVLISIYNWDGICLMMNTKVAERSGGEPADFQGKSFFELHPEAGEKYLGRIREVIETGETREYEDMVEFTQGSRWLLSKVQPVRDSTGQIYAAQIVSQDITERKLAELEMQTAADIVRAIPSGLFIYRYEEPDRLILLDSNPEAERLTGISTSEWQGREFNEIWPEAQARGLTEAFLNVMKTGQMFETEDTYYKDNRIEGAYRIHTFKMSGSRLGVAFEDVTMGYKAEAALRESEARFRELFNNMSNSVAIYEAIDNGRDFIFKDINDIGAKYYPGGKEEMIGRSVLDIFPELEKPGIHDVFRRVWKTGQAEHHPHVLYSDERVSMWLEFYVCKLPSGELVAVYNDITEQETAAEALKRSEERYRILFESANDPILVEDPETGVLLDANKAAERLTGYSREEIIGKHRLFLFPPTENNELRQAPDHDSEQPMDQLLELDVVNKAGQLIPVEISSGGLVNIGGEKVHFGIFRDISERKRAEMEKAQLEGQLRQAQKMEAIGTLAGGIAHDFNNILAAILGYAELALYDTKEGMPIRTNLERIQIAGQRAKDLVNQILAFSRKAESERKVIQLAPIVKESLKMLRATIPSTIEIKQNIQPDAGMTEADPTQVHQLLINLCTNAADALAGQSGTITVSLASKTLNKTEVGLHGDIPPGRYIVLAVEDTGTGIDEQVLDRIFDPFFTTKALGRGTGMGLSVVHGIVTGNGGYIRLESEPGQGAGFHIYLPARDAATQEGPKAESDAPIQGSGHILFVDDEDALVDFADQIFPKLGYEVTAINSSTEALDVFRTDPQKFDLIITDMTMPELTGVELAQKVHELNSKIPIILCSGFSDQISVETMKDSGILHLLNKPMDLHQAARLMHEILALEENGLQGEEV